MSRSLNERWIRFYAVLFAMLFAFDATPSLNAADSSGEIPFPTTTEGSPSDVQERGLGKAQFGEMKKQSEPMQPSQPQQTLPAQLCHAETRMMTQCKCFNQAECQPLTALFPGPCPAGSQHCEFVPMSRGPMPSLPPDLCGYQTPLTLTKCVCHNQAECQLLSPFCPGSCPAGSQSCECTPMLRR